MTDTTFILWGIPVGESDRLHEKPLTSFPITKEQAGKVQLAAAKDGWHSFRLARETGQLPDFRNVF